MKTKKGKSTNGKNMLSVLAILLPTTFAMLTSCDPPSTTDISVEVGADDTDIDADTLFTGSHDMPVDSIMNAEDAPADSSAGLN